jgi:hypothetical protein
MGRKKKVISKSFLYFYPKSFFSALFPTIRSHVLYQKPWICFCMLLSPSTRSFSLALFSPGTLSFFLFTKRAGKLRMHAPRPRAYMRARDRFLRGWERWRGRMSNYWNDFFLILLKKIKDGKVRWQTVENALSIYTRLATQTCTASSFETVKAGTEARFLYSGINLAYTSYKDVSQ